MVDVEVIEHFGLLIGKADETHPLGGMVKTKGTTFPVEGCCVIRDGDRRGQRTIFIDEHLDDLFIFLD